MTTNDVTVIVPPPTSVISPVNVLRLETPAPLPPELPPLFVMFEPRSITPLILEKFNIDPALATGPFVTTINDIIGLTVYFSLGRILLGA
jgi:hypothetical protein